MISAESVEFFPTVLANCWIGWMACRASALFQPASWVVVQSPYARFTVGTPYRASSASRAGALVEETLSASMSTASRTVVGSVTDHSYHPAPVDTGAAPR